MNKLTLCAEIAAVIVSYLVCMFDRQEFNNNKYVKTKFYFRGSKNYRRTIGR